jgi:hypothetical protein
VVFFLPAYRLCRQHPPRPRVLPQPHTLRLKASPSRLVSSLHNLHHHIRLHLFQVGYVAPHHAWYLRHNISSTIR